MQYIKAAFDKCLDFLFPRRCLSCRSFISDLGMCHTCWQSIDFISNPICIKCGRPTIVNVFEEVTCSKCLSSPPIYDKARSLMRFNDKSQRMIYMFKYYDPTILADLFARSLYARYKDEILEHDYIVAVPMHRLKRIYRGYNQSDILACSLAKISNIPFIRKAILKYKWTRPQSSLKRKERMQNLYGSFKVCTPEINGKKILLVDDVITTGTTINICSAILKEAGAKSVVAISIACT